MATGIWMTGRRASRALVGFAVAAVCVLSSSAMAEHSVARQWNDLLLDAIRNDFARPTVHARNLYHTSVAMWDAWACYSMNAEQVIHQEKIFAADPDPLREESISYAAYRVITARFAKSPGSSETLAAANQLMEDLGYDPAFTATLGMTPAAVGNRIAISVLFFGLHDNANEQGGYANLFYMPVNEPLVPALPGNPEITDPNRWQPLALDFFVDQGGNVIVGGFPEALSPEWGIVTPFALSPDDLTIYPDKGFDWWVYHDPGPPPMINTGTEDAYKAGFQQVVLASGLLDPSDGVMIDISPATRGNSTLGTNDGTGYKMNPFTGQPYEPNSVPAGDYYRVLAEFWADGPESETPPGHWFTLLNYVSDQTSLEKRIGGSGSLLDDLQWDVKSYLMMGGAMHDAAVTAWGIKGYYDYLRPISAIRFMCDLGQSSDMGGPSYDPDGITLVPGKIEVVTAESTMPGGIHEHLADGGDNIGKIAVYAWRGPDYIVNPDTDTAGVDWILAENWWPYQRPSFVTPPFPGYISGHSTYSRAAAELLTQLTGSEWFPGGLGEFYAPQNEYLVFEEGPSADVTLQWAKYYDAADESGLSRIYGGIHPPADDFPGRIIGAEIGDDAFDTALVYFEGTGYVPCPFDMNDDANVGTMELLGMLGVWGTNDPTYDFVVDGIIDVNDLLLLFDIWGPCPN